MLQSDRLFFKLPTNRDAPRITEFLNRADTALMMTNVPLPYTLSDAYDFIDRVNDPINKQKAIFNNIYDQIDGQLVGAIGIIFRSDRNNDGNTEPELGFWLGYPYWGRGLIAEAAIVLIEHFFDVTEYQELFVSHAIKNPQSKRVIEKLGFSFVNNYQIEVPIRDTIMNSKRYRLSKADWQEL